MNSKYLRKLLIIIVFAFAKANSQIHINEIDTDTPSVNDAQFIELKTAQAFQSLDGYILVLFNGRDNLNRSYYSISLDGLTSDINHLIVLGSSKTVPAVDLLLPETVIQIGADAIAIYQDDVERFPENTLPTQENLIDALAYDTDDTDDVELLQALGLENQYNENQNGMKTTQSIQRIENGGYEVKDPTPHSRNDITTPDYNGINFRLNPNNEIEEGESFSITFTLDKPAENDLILPFTLANDAFDNQDYRGSTQLVIPTGEQFVTYNYTTIDDSIDEGDELLLVNVSNATPSGYKRLVDLQELLVIDNDFTVSDYGNPINPTYDRIQSSAPTDYYDSLNNTAGEELSQRITNLIAQSGVVRHHNYADVISILKEADRSADNSNKVWLLYLEEERRSINFQGKERKEGQWNREHIFSRSRGGYNSIKDLDEMPDGIDVWEESNVDSLRHGNSDAHHLRATDPSENSSRGAKNYPDYNGPEDTAGSWKGDVARSIFYMAHRYKYTDSQLLQVINGDPTTGIGAIGDLKTLLEWHRKDPPDDFEMNRNNVIYKWQRNRNPFIDIPQLSDYIWGEQAGEVFTLSTSNNLATAVRIYPNPTKGVLHLENIQQPTSINILDTMGRICYRNRIERDVRIELNLSSGLYFIELGSYLGKRITKLVVE